MIYTVGTTPVQIAAGRAARGRQNSPVARYLIVNRDETGQAYIASDWQDAGNIPGLELPAASIVDPLGSITVPAGVNWWAVSASAAKITIDVIADGGEWSPSPAQIAVQLQALGLATDASVQQVTATLGTPAQTGDIGNLHASGNTVAQELTGIGAPWVQNLANQSASATAASLSTVFYTFGAAARIWAVQMAHDFSSNGSFTGTSSQQAQLVRTNEVMLTSLLRLRNASEVQHAAPSLTFPGLPCSAGDTLRIAFDGNPSNTTGEVSATVLYSVP